MNNALFNPTQFWRRASSERRGALTVGAACAVGGVALSRVAWRFIGRGAEPSISAFVFASPALSGAPALLYWSLPMLAAVAVGRYRVNAFSLLLVHVIACVHLAHAATQYPTGHVDGRSVIAFQIAFDVGRATILAGLLCMGLAIGTQQEKT